MSVSANTIDFTSSRFNARALKSTTFTALAITATGLALLPLASIIFLLMKKGGGRISWSLFVTAGVDGGFGHALVGTFVMVGLASLIAVPLGVLAAIHLSEFSPGSRSTSTIRFSARVLSGLPSILAGVFAYTLVVVGLKGGFSAIAGAVALSLLMIPTVVLAAEQALQSVPQRLRDAAFGLGATKSQTVLKVVVPTAWPGMLTGVLLAVGRAAGETAPLLFTALASRYWLLDSRLWSTPLSGWRDAMLRPTASLSVLIYDSSSQADERQRELAWAAALVLVLAVLLVNVASRVWSGAKR